MVTAAAPENSADDNDADADADADGAGVRAMGSRIVGSSAQVVLVARLRGTAGGVGDRVAEGAFSAAPV